VKGVSVGVVEPRGARAEVLATAAAPDVGWRHQSMEGPWGMAEPSSEISRRCGIGLSRGRT
jgi:hypothetical protein